MPGLYPPFAQRPFSDDDEVGRVAQHGLCDRVSFDDLQGKSDALSSALGDRPSHRSNQIHSAPRIWASVSRSETKLLPMLRVNISSVSGVIAESTRWLAQWL